MKYAPPRRSASPLKTVFLTLLTIALGGAGTAGGLWAAGVKLPFLNREPDNRGLVGVPITARAIPAYTKITRDFLLVPEKGVPKYMYLPPNAVKAMGVLTSFNQIIGRVVDHEKPPGYPFKEDDFLPKGTRPGLVAAIPPGKRALTIDATRIQGIHSLKPGDTLDILASTPVDMQKVFQGGKGGSGASNVQMNYLAQSKHADVRVLVQFGTLISPVTTRVIPISSSSLTQGAVTKTKPIQEVVLALDPEEIAPLTEAIAVEANITCVARSGRPEDPGMASRTPAGFNPVEHVAPVETIFGGRREVMFVPRPRSALQSTRGMVAVPLCAKPLLARATIARDDFVDPKTGKLHVVYLRPEDVNRLGLVIDFARLVGRVLKREKHADYGFKEDDFEPAETLPRAATAAVSTATGAGSAMSGAGTPGARSRPPGRPDSL